MSSSDRTEADVNGANELPPYTCLKSRKGSGFIIDRAGSAVARLEPAADMADGEARVTAPQKERRETGSS